MSCVESNPIQNERTSFEIDLLSTATQPMSSTLTTHAVLQETVYGWLKGTTMFFSLTDMANFTYGDFVNHIGCEANEYRLDPRGNCRVYTWFATDKENAKFSAFFKENENGEWTINASGSVQISMPDDYLERLKSNING